MKSIPWDDLKVGDYIKVKFYIKRSKDVTLIGKVSKIYGDNISVIKPDGVKFFLYSSGLGVADNVTSLVNYKAFKARESEYLADTI